MAYPYLLITGQKWRSLDFILPVTESTHAESLEKSCAHKKGDKTILGVN
jgi:hypothetical protein